MPWFKVDDAFSVHPKVLVAGNAALGGWVRAGSWCAQQLTDGFVPAGILPVLGLRTRDAKALVVAGLWHEAEGGYQFHAWNEYQPTKEAVEHDRAMAAERQKRARDKARESRRDEGVTHGEVQAQSRSPRPDPTQPIEEPSSEIAGAIPDKEPKDEGEREDVERICVHLADRIEENGSRRPTISKTWRREGRLLIDKDGISEERIHTAIDWCQNDTFWKANILSMAKLREKYHQMRLRASGRTSSTEPRKASGPPTEILNDPTKLTEWYEARVGA